MFDFTGIIVVAILFVVLVFIGKVLIIAFFVKMGIDLFNAHQQAFDRALTEQQRALTQVQGQGSASGAPGVSIPPEALTRFQTAYFRASRELDQLSDLRRQQSELRLADMRSQAASMGIFIND